MLETRNSAPVKKFSDPDWTAKGEKRALVPFVQLKTLWVNTGTLCNLACDNCYIESSPTNDRLEYIRFEEVRPYIDEIIEHNLGTQTIGFTGGEPFMNPHMMRILNYCLENGLECLVLTNAMQPLKKKRDELLELKQKYLSLLKIRVSLDHYTQLEHEKERGKNSWKFALEGLNWLNQNNFSLSVAGRNLTNEPSRQMLEGYQNLFSENNIDIDVNDIEQLVVFPEMDTSIDTPEITTQCWGILNKKPTDIMCSNSRMLVKQKGQVNPNFTACTLLPYEKDFNMGSRLKDSFTSVKLNHSHCSRFCVLGGGACSQ